LIVVFGFPQFIPSLYALFGFLRRRLVADDEGQRRDT
jgi:hypothetical protein